LPLQSPLIPAPFNGHEAPSYWAVGESDSNIVLSGMAADTSGTITSGSIIATSPVGGPNKILIYPAFAGTYGGTSVNTRVDVHPDGTIVYQGPNLAATGYVSLDGILFSLVNSNDPSFTPLTYASGFSAYPSSSFAPIASKQTGFQVCLKGLAYTTQNYVEGLITTLPAGQAPPNTLIILVEADSSPQAILVETSGAIKWFNPQADVTGWVSLDGVVFSTAPTGLGWVTMSLGSGWINESSDAQGGEYLLDGYGMVWLRGMVTSSGTQWTQTNGGVIFVLPVGYRPSARLTFPIWTELAANRIDVFPTGEVWMSTTGNGWVTLSGIRFYATQ